MQNFFQIRNACVAWKLHSTKTFLCSYFYRKVLASILVFAALLWTRPQRRERTNRQKLTWLNLGWKGIIHLPLFRNCHFFKSGFQNSWCFFHNQVISKKYPGLYFWTNREITTNLGGKTLEDEKKVFVTFAQNPTNENLFGNYRFSYWLNRKIFFWWI